MSAGVTVFLRVGLQERGSRCFSLKPLRVQKLFDLLEIDSLLVVEASEMSTIYAEG